MLGGCDGPPQPSSPGIIRMLGGCDGPPQPSSPGLIRMLGGCDGPSPGLISAFISWFNQDVGWV